MNKTACTCTPGTICADCLASIERDNHPMHSRRVVAAPPQPTDQCYRGDGLLLQLTSRRLRVAYLAARKLN